jgi:hypothetical protein
MKILNIGILSRTCIEGALKSIWMERQTRRCEQAHKEVEKRKTKGIKVCGENVMKREMADDTDEKKGKAIPLTAHEGPYGCETSRHPHFLDNRLTDGGEVVSPTRRAPFNTRAVVRLEGLGQLKNPMTSSGIVPATFLLVA